MSRHDKYVIEARTEAGSLDLAAPQPEKFFGDAAITGIGEDAMAQRIFAKFPAAVLSGVNIPDWPKHFDPRFKARKKTW